MKTSTIAPGRGVAALFLFTSLTLFTSVDAKQSPQAPVFKSKIDLVHLDVSVLDKDRRPVRGLTKADFTVLEDGKPQDITIFEAIDVPDPEPPQIEWMRDVTPDVTTNEARPTRLWVLVVDEALIPTDPATIEASKEILRHIVDKFGREDLVSIVFTADSRGAQEFTNDRSKLLATLDRFSPGLAYWKNTSLGVPAGTQPAGVKGLEDTLRKQDEQFWLGSVNTLRNVMESLIGMPQSRKALIWVSPGIPMVSPLPVNTRGSDVHLRLRDLTTEVLATAKRANVPVYPIDPCGLGGLEQFITGRIGNAVPDYPPPPWVESQDYAVLTAVNTGGHAIINTNDFDPGIDKIFEENGSYYLIGYSPSNVKVDGTLRGLTVKVNRDHVDVRTRSGYFAPKPADAAPRSTNAVLANAVVNGVPVRELPLRAAVAPFAIPGSRTAAVTIALGVRQPVPDSAASERVTVSTDLRVSAFNTEGDNKGTQRSVAKVVLRAGAQGDADYEALSRIDLTPGRYSLRLAAHLEAVGKTGTVIVDVTVPDFGRDPASMSGVAISATPGRPAAPRDLFTNVLPVVPTAQRVFGRSDEATALFYLYQSGAKPLAAARMSTRITDVRGSRLIDEVQTIGIDRFVTAQESQAATARPAPSVPPGQQSRADPFANKGLRAAEVQYALPFARLPTGPYLLTFEGTIGTITVRRDVRFEVQ